MCRRTNAAPKEPPPRQVRDDGWDADTEDAEPVVIKKDVKRSTFDKGFSRVTPVDDVRFDSVVQLGEWCDQ